MYTDIHYFDHAMTSRPKAPGVIEAMTEFYRDICVSPSRSGHRLGEAANHILAQARETACEYFGARSPNHIVFTSGATESLNLVIYSILKQGDEVVTSSFDHNSVIRPIARLRETGVIVRTITASSNTSDFVDRFVASFNDRVKLAILTQASNVDGTGLPVSKITTHAKERGIPVLVDGAQSVGWLSQDHLRCEFDYFAASLHKGLLGPFGLGVLVIGHDDAVLRPLKAGGTGLESLNPLPQSVIPHGLETGTINAAAIAGAVPAFEYALSKEAQELTLNVMHLFQVVLDELALLVHIRTFGPIDKDCMVPVVSLQHEQLDANTFARILDREYGILGRAGLHCAPLRHRDIGTFPEGTVRISFGHTTTEENTKALVHALQKLDKEDV